MSFYVGNAGLLCPDHRTVCHMARGCTSILAGVHAPSHLASFLWWWGLPLGYGQDEGKRWKNCEAPRKNGWCRLPKESPGLWLAACPHFRDALEDGVKTGLWPG